MACTMEELTDGGRSRRHPPPPASLPEVSVSDALILATFWMIGMEVEVQARDGSVYSGIFHTASVDEDYGVVLKKAILVKKGGMISNVAADTLIETLVVGSENFVQVVVKGDKFSSAEVCDDSLDMDSEVVELVEPRGDNDVTFGSVAHEGDKFGGSFGDDRVRVDKIVKIDPTLNISSDARQAGDRLNAIEDGDENGRLLEDNAVINEVQASSRNDNCFDGKPTAAEDSVDNSTHQESQGPSSGFTKPVEEQSNEKPCVEEIAAVEVKSESQLSDASNLSTMVPPKSKASKLNPGAKIFSPSSVYHRTATPTNFSYIPNATYTGASLITVQDEVDASSFDAPSVPVKFFPYSTISDGTYVQPMLGQMTNRAQPVRYTSQYQSIHSGAQYVHPNPQNIIYGNGRIQPVLFLQAVSSDVAQSAPIFTPATSPRPVIRPHQPHGSKHQRIATPQALQVGMPPGQLPFLLPASITLPPPFPVSYPVPAPGRMGS